MERVRERETGGVRGDRRGCKRGSRGEKGEMMEGTEESGMGQRSCSVLVSPNIFLSLPSLLLLSKMSQY